VEARDRVNKQFTYKQAKPYDYRILREINIWELELEAFLYAIEQVLEAKPIEEDRRDPSLKNKGSRAKKQRKRKKASLDLAFD